MDCRVFQNGSIYDGSTWGNEGHHRLEAAHCFEEGVLVRCNHFNGEFANHLRLCASISLTATTCTRVSRLLYFFEGHVFDFEDGFMTLSNSQVNLLASKLSILESNTLDTALAVRRVVPEKLRYFVGLKAVRDATTGGRSGIDLEPDTCAWNLLLKRRCVLTIHSIFGMKTGRCSWCAVHHLETNLFVCTIGGAAEDSKG